MATSCRMELRTRLSANAKSSLRFGLRVTSLRARRSIAQCSPTELSIAIPKAGPNVKIGVMPPVPTNAMVIAASTYQKP